MSNGNISLSFRLDFEPLKLFLDRVDAEMAKAVEDAVRAAGKASQRTAQSKAPVLTGRLRNSITPGKVWTDGTSINVSVGPRGYPHLYAQKEERRTPYMAAGTKAASDVLQATMEAAVEKVWRE